MKVMLSAAALSAKGALEYCTLVYFGGLCASVQGVIVIEQRSDAHVNDSDASDRARVALSELLAFRPSPSVFERLGRWLPLLLALLLRPRPLTQQRRWPRLLWPWAAMAALGIACSS